MVKAVPPTGSLQFQGRRDYPYENEVDDWGLTPQQQETYVEQFRRILASKNLWKEEQHDYFLLRRFLRARSYDLEKATLMWANSMAWREEHQVDTILQDFYFQEREKFLELYPQGYHKVDKLGRPVYIQNIGKINMAELRKITDDKRMIKFHIQEYERFCKVVLPVVSHLAGRNIDQTMGIMDVKGVGLSHLTGEVKRLLSIITKYDSDNYPEMMGHMCIINAPTVFRMVWAVVKNMIDVRTQSKIEILGADYTGTLLQWIDAESLPEFLGGKSKGSLSDDVGPWSDPEVLQRLGMDVEELKNGKHPAPQLPHQLSLTASASFGPDGRMMSDADAYHSPVSSTGDLSQQISFRNASSSRIAAGVTLEVLDETARRLATTSAAGAAAPNAAVRVAAPSSTIAPIPEGGQSTKTRTLIERIAALEQLLPPHMDGLKASAQEAEPGKDLQGAQSTRSAPEGSLLHRVEVLEDAMQTLLAAQEASLQYQQQLLTQKQPKKSKRRTCCCTVM